MRHFRLMVILTAGFTLLTAPLYADTGKVTLTTLEWPPYIANKIPGHGYVYEIVSEAFKSVGYTVDIQFYPWRRALETAKSGKADGLFPEYYGEGRKTEFVFSDSFPGGPVGFLARKDSKIAFPSDPRKDLTKTLQRMNQYSYGVVRGYLNTEEFDAADFLKKEEATSDELNIEKLYARRIQLIFIDKFVAQYLIKTDFPQYAKDLEFIEPPLEVKPLHIVFSRKAPDYVKKMKAFNQGLSNLRKKGTIKAIMKEYGF